MALGRGRLAPIAAHASVYWLLDRAFIGLPCPKKTAGIMMDMRLLSFNADYVIYHPPFTEMVCPVM
jgi:hypothetical protein